VCVYVSACLPACLRTKRLGLNEWQCYREASLIVLAWRKKKLSSGNDTLKRHSSADENEFQLM
jgi:hypothetical protein